MEKSQLRIEATQVQPLMAGYMPIDGLGIVVDFEKSHGAHLYDAKTDQFYLDFLSFYASLPLGFNHHSTASRVARLAFKSSRRRSRFFERALLSAKSGSCSRDSRSRTRQSRDHIRGVATATLMGPSLAVKLP